MFHFSLREMVFGLWRGMMPHTYTSDNPKRSLLITLSLSLCDYDKKTDVREWRDILITQNRAAYTKRNEDKEWEFLSAHESCWINSVERYFIGLYFEWAEKVNPDVPPCDLYQFCSLLQVKHVMVSDRVAEGEDYKRVVHKILALPKGS